MGEGSADSLTKVERYEAIAGFHAETKERPQAWPIALNFGSADAFPASVARRPTVMEAVFFFHSTTGEAK
jgi:hypothetical protein